MDEVKDIEKGTSFLTVCSSESTPRSSLRTKVANSTCSRRWFTTLGLSDFKPTPQRLLNGLPALTLGAILNLLDVVSTGMLIFPSGSDPLVIWLGMSVYMMSIIAGQLAVTLGGSTYPGAVGSMLVEVIPLLREIVIDLESAVGLDSPALVPTTLVAWAICSLSMGVVFLMLGACRAGWLLQYFPRAVLTGIVGGIGVHLFIMSFEIFQPATHPHLSWDTLGEQLFSARQLPLTLATVLPAVVIYFTVRFKLCARLPRGGDKVHEVFIPGFMLIAAALFWIGAAAAGRTSTAGIKGLVADGWLFDVQSARGSNATGIGIDIDVNSNVNYWQLFDFSKVQWEALGAAAKNIVLVVLIGVANLPVAIGALETMVPDVQPDVDRELLGSGVANLLAGAVGSLPTLIVFSYTRLFTMAGGGRLEGLLLSGLTIVMLFVAHAIIPYVPTMLASTLVAYIGIDLALDAIWDGFKTSRWPDYVVLLGTMLISIFLGIAIGLCAGLGMALICQFLRKIPFVRDKFS